MSSKRWGTFPLGSIGLESSPGHVAFQERFEGSVWRWMGGRWAAFVLRGVLRVVMGSSLGTWWLLPAQSETPSLSGLSGLVNRVLREVWGRTFCKTQRVVGTRHRTGFRSLGAAAAARTERHLHETWILSARRSHRQEPV